MARLSPRRQCQGSKGPELPAFCRSRRPTITVTQSGMRNLTVLLLLVLVVQLSTLLLVISGTSTGAATQPPSQQSGRAE